LTVPHLEAEADALTAAGCERIFADKVSGRLVRRAELDEALPNLMKRCAGCAPAISSW
jgi:hypothetical protein